nr:hypothetical protein [Ktedonobacterales bacterium]
VYSSARVGIFAQDVTIPLVSEQGQWRVTWTPGLIFTQLDDPGFDPSYQRKVRLAESQGNRGTIYDKDGNVIAKDLPVWQIVVNTGQAGDEGKLVQALGNALALPTDQIKTNYETAWPCGPQGYRLVSTLTQQPSSQSQSALSAIAGVSVSQTTRRVYPYGQDLAAVTGYVSPISADEYNGDKSHVYGSCDFVGHTGVEAWGEPYLRPVKGGVLKIVNANADGSDGPTAYTVASRTAANGADVHTTIALADQQATMKALRANRNGTGSGAFAVNPTTGEVLVMASNPACDPNTFSLGNTAGQQSCVNDTVRHPLLNNALQATVPTGSIFKMVTLAAALENGVSPTDTFFCPGYYQIPGQAQKSIDDKPTGHGTLTGPAAIAPSCDVVFWQLGVKLGDKDPNIVPTMARAFGYGAPTGVVGVSAGLEAAGLVPDPQYYRDKKNANWAPVNSANLAIGQDDFQASPAQVAMVSQAIANNGVRLQPRLVTSITSGNTVIATFPLKQIGTVPVSASNMTVIQVAMEGVTQPGGTSYDVFKGFPILVAGKTGTAQACDNCGALPHAWFTYYAPASPPSGPSVPPQLAMAVLFANAGGGDQNAAPVCRALLIAHFGLSSSQSTSGG